MFFRSKLITTIFVCLLAAPVVVHGQTLTAMWDPNPPSDGITGYEVCVGTASLSCNTHRATVAATDTSYTFAVQAGVLYYVAVRAVSGAVWGQYSSEVRISIPSLTQPSNQASTVNVPISPLTLTASDPDGGTLQFSHTGLPFGVNLNTSTGVITGTPTTTGTFTVTVFVTDGFETTSRSFGWTVQPSSTPEPPSNTPEPPSSTPEPPSSAPDRAAPTLRITSHNAGQTVTTSSITVSGWATDSGSGDAGISSVTVNGEAATGGTSPSHYAANWSRNVSLAIGANVITVEARDGANNLSASQITINRTGTAPLSVTSLTSSVPSPQNVGAAINFTAVATGGTSPYQFKWWVQSGGVWTLAREWSTSPSLTWQPTSAGSYTVAVWARNAGTTADASQALAQVPFVVGAGNSTPLSISNLTSSAPSPQNVGTAINFNATATGGSSPYQFKWWVQNGGVWTVARDWSTSPSMTWQPTTKGTYTVAVWARNAGATADAGQALAQVPYVIGAANTTPLSITTFTSSAASPQATDTTINFTAAAAGGTAPYQFKWWIKNATTWSVAQDWSSKSTLSWRPMVAGTYIVAVWARNAGVTDDASQAIAQVSYSITPGTPQAPLVMSLTSSVRSPQVLGNAVTFTAAVGGGRGPHEFKWWVHDGTQWTVAREWGTGHTLNWQPTRTGTYVVAAWVRNAGVTVDASQALAQTTFVMSVARDIPPAITAFTNSVASPTVAGTTVTFNTVASGGQGAYEFKWWVFSGGSWSVAQNWSNSSAFTWKPATPGNYIVAVWVRNNGVPADASQALAQVNYIVKP